MRAEEKKSQPARKPPTTRCSWMLSVGERFTANAMPLQLSPDDFFIEPESIHAYSSSNHPPTPRSESDLSDFHFVFSSLVLGHPLALGNFIGDGGGGTRYIPRERGNHHLARVCKRRSSSTRSLELESERLQFIAPLQPAIYLRPTTGNVRVHRLRAEFLVVGIFARWCTAVRLGHFSRRVRDPIIVASVTLRTCRMSAGLIGRGAT